MIVILHQERGYGFRGHFDFFGKLLFLDRSSIGDGDGLFRSVFLLVGFVDWFDCLQDKGGFNSVGVDLVAGVVKHGRAPVFPGRYGIVVGIQ